MKKPSINVATRDTTIRPTLESIKENIEIITGRRTNLSPIAPLSSTATTTDIINKLNEILDRLQ